MSSDPVVLLGESGMLGGYVSLALKERGIPTGVPPRFDAAKITDAELRDILAASHPRVVINCIGVIRQRETRDEDMQAVNAEFPHRLASACAALKVPLIHISTDCVFSGERGHYRESDTPDALDSYGRSKAAGEPAGATVVRTSIIGSERHNKRSLLEWVKTRAGSEADGYQNQRWNGVTCLQLAHFLVAIIESGVYWQGVRHYFSPRAITKHELVSLISDAYGLDVHVQNVDAKEARDMTLASDYSFVSPPDIREQLSEMADFDKAHRLL